MQGEGRGGGGGGGERGRGGGGERGRGRGGGGEGEGRGGWGRGRGEGGGGRAHLSPKVPSHKCDIPQPCLCLIRVYLLSVGPITDDYTNSGQVLTESSGLWIHAREEHIVLSASLTLLRNLF